MIPKTIHYCWFGRNPKPDLAKKCMRSWKKYCKGYEIIEWNEDNFDLSTAPLYVRQAYEAKKWAFVTDWVRLKVVYDHGGIYLDTDVELIKKIDFLLQYQAYFGFERGQYIATGLGFGATKGTPILEQLMEDYATIPFILPDGTFDMTPCPVRNTAILKRHGLLLDDSLQLLDGKIQILPSAYLAPPVFSLSRKLITSETVSIHWYSASWESAQERERIGHSRKAAKKARRKTKWANINHTITHFPNQIAKFLLGSKRYDKLKKTFSSIH